MAKADAAHPARVFSATHHGITVTITYDEGQIPAREIVFRALGEVLLATWYTEVQKHQKLWSHWQVHRLPGSASTTRDIKGGGVFELHISAWAWCSYRDFRNKLLASIRQQIRNAFRPAT
jgi:hypothetical protein